MNVISTLDASRGKMDQICGRAEGRMHLCECSFGAVKHSTTHTITHSILTGMCALARMETGVRELISTVQPHTYMRTPSQSNLLSDALVVLGSSRNRTNWVLQTRWRKTLKSGLCCQSKPLVCRRLSDRTLTRRLSIGMKLQWTARGRQPTAMHWRIWMNQNTNQ